MRPARLGTKAPAATAPTLRPFQQEDVDFIKEHDYNVLVASSPGTGKTPLALSCVTGDRVKLTPTVVVCPASVVTNWCREAKKWVPGAVIHAIADLGSPMPRKRVDIVVISWALLADRYLDLVALKPKFIIADECFPAGTPVLTEEGSLFIEAIRPGMRVWSRGSDGAIRLRRVVRHIEKTLRQDLVRVTHAAGNFVCTGNHKVWTDEEGYVEAAKLTSSHSLCVLREGVHAETVDTEDVFVPVFSPRVRSKAGKASGREILSHLREDFPLQGDESSAFLHRCVLLEAPAGAERTTDENVRVVWGGLPSGSGREKEVLQPELLCEVEDAPACREGGDEEGHREVRSLSDGHRAPGCVYSDEDQQPHVGPCDSGEGTSEVDRSHLPVSGREWETHSRAGGGSRCARASDGASDPYLVCPTPVSEPAPLLQGGCGVSGVLPRGGDRRCVPQAEEVEVFGCAKDRGVERARVARVEVLQRAGSVGPYGGGGDHSVVYDLEVEEDHNYFASGVLVSNCHYVKESEALRSQAFNIVSRRTPHKILLSGTPVVNKSGELATIKSYFNVAGEVPMIRRLLEDVLPEIPPKARSTLSVRLRPKDAADYQRAEEDFADWLDRELKRRMSQGEAQAAAERALAAEALTKTGYLRRLLGLAKIPSAVDWISRAVRVGEPVVVFCEHQEVVTRLQRLLTKQNIRHVTIDGGTGRRQRQIAIDTFQAGFAPVFIGTKAAKEGITLTRARNLLFVERYFTSADEEQAEDRIRRYGQKYETTIWFLHAAGTLDDRLSEIIDTKRRLVNEVIGGSTVEETEEDAVRELIAAWHENAVKHHQPDAEPTDLGLGKPLPPLPDVKECYQLTFKKPRWAKPSATVWCAMHGFRVTETAATTAGVRVTSVPLARFVPGTFRTVQVSADITAVLGTRKPTAKKAVSKPRTGGAKHTTGAKKPTKKRPARSTPSVSIRSPLLGRW